MAKTRQTTVQTSTQTDVTADTLREAAREHADAALTYRTAQRVANEAVQAMQTAKDRAEAASKRYAALSRKVLAG